jgi:hypothetical protein
MPIVMMMILAAKNRVKHNAGSIRDGNGIPIFDSPRGIPPLGDRDREVSSPTGI